VENAQTSDERWFALRVKSRCEKVVATIARNKGFEEFVPFYHCRRRWSDRTKSIDVPLFPGYVFCRLVAEKRFPLLTIPGVLHFVGIGRTPVAMNDSEIAAIQAAVVSSMPMEPWPFLEVGQRVRLTDGPLAGVEGIFIGDSRQERIVVSVTLLRRSVAVAIERRWAAPLSSSAQFRKLQPQPHRD